MDENLTRDLIIADLRVLGNKIAELDPTYNITGKLNDEVMGSLSLADLTSLKRDMRDVLRSLGGARS